MNFLNLEYFLIAAKELNFTQAAKKLFISQQALSNHIKKLEDYFQVDLFDRSPPLSLTYEGQCLVKHANEILSIKDNANKEINDMRNFQSGVLSVGSPPSWGRLMLPYILPSYIELYPNIDIILEEGSPSEIISKLRNGTLDLGFGFMPDECIELRSETLSIERILLLVPLKLIRQNYNIESENIIASLRKKPDLSLIMDCPFLLSDESSRTGTIVRDIFRYMGLKPKVILESSSLEVLIQLCLRGIGCMFCPETFISEAIRVRNNISPDELGVFELEHPTLKREIAISFNKDKYITRAAYKFIDLAKNCVNEGPFSMGKYI